MSLKSRFNMKISIGLHQQKIKKFLRKDPKIYNNPPIFLNPRQVTGLCPPSQNLKNPMFNTV